MNFETRFPRFVIKFHQATYTMLNESNEKIIKIVKTLFFAKIILFLKN